MYPIDYVKNTTYPDRSMPRLGVGDRVLANFEGNLIRCTIIMVKNLLSNNPDYTLRILDTGVVRGLWLSRRYSQVVLISDKLYEKFPELMI